MTLYDNDRKLQNKYGIIAGIDEAGRGPLAGPVVIAAVCLDPLHPIDGVNDSKKISERSREQLFPEILQHSPGYSIVIVPHDVIDEINILQATLWGMRQAAKSLLPVPALFLIDGNKIPTEMPGKSVAVVKGDSHHACIAAASILAKVTRDRIMRELHEDYPVYNFLKHKGYPTPEHLSALRRYGPCRFHRKSYAPVAQLILDL
ncbi:MAG: ribonuclease HII [Candidatus Cloacimonetes bacterium]|nr:ribonuclease HII [Candidatus Cloacimonadota bacterium]